MSPLIKPVGFGRAAGGGSGGGTVSFVDSDVLPTPNSTSPWDLSISIGANTDRKIITGIMIEYDINDALVWTVTFDPGGADEASFTAVTGGAVEFASGGFAQRVETFRLDISNAVTSGTYTVRVAVTGQVGETNLAAVVSAVALDTAAANDPEAVETETIGSATAISPTITTGEADTIVIDFLSINGDATGLGVDDGQTQRHTASGDSGLSTDTMSGGVSTIDSASAQTLNTGWSWTNSSNRNAHVAVSVATAP